MTAEALRFSMKLPETGYQALTLPFADPRHYGLGKHGWITFKPSSRISKALKEQFFGWARESYRAVAPKKLARALEEPAAPAKKKRGPGKAGRLSVVVLAAMTFATRGSAQTPPAASQNPSPMVENTRAHRRLTQREMPGTAKTFSGPDGKPVDVFIPESARRASVVNLVIHFLGAAWIPEIAVSQLGKNNVVAVLNLGAGSGVYDRAFSNPAAFDTLLASIGRELTNAAGMDVKIGRITLSGFSAGHGAVRAILREPRHFARIDEILLLDGMHTSYVPEGVVMEKGGSLDPKNLEAFVRFAEEAVKGNKRFLITHSEIFPGTFASTTETADYLLKALGLKRTPVLKWGPNGMQQLSEVHAGHFELMGFAGNTAPDHIDQFHGMPEFLARLNK